MSIVPRKNPNDLTPEEVKFLKSAGTPDIIKEFLSRQHDNIGTQFTAHRKVSAAAGAKADALLAVRRLRMEEGEIATVEAALAEAELMRKGWEEARTIIAQQRLALEASGREVDAAKVLASGAQAISSGRD